LRPVRRGWRIAARGEQNRPQSDNPRELHGSRVYRGSRAAVVATSEPAAQQRQPDLDAALAAVRHRRQIHLGELDLDPAAAEPEIDPRGHARETLDELDVARQPERQELLVAGAEPDVGPPA